MVQGQTALFHAAQANQLDTVDTLLSLGAQPMANDATASLLLMFAVSVTYAVQNVLLASAARLPCKLSLP